MDNNQGGSKRELSIYSILTIIVLISISGGRETRGQTNDINIHDNDALLVTEDFLNERDRWIEDFSQRGEKPKYRITEKKSKDTNYNQKDKNGIRETKVMEIAEYGKKSHKVFSEGQVLSEKGIFKDGWLEINPGSQYIFLKLYRENIDLRGYGYGMEKMRGHENVKHEVQVKNTEIVPHGVYVLYGEIDCSRYFVPDGYYELEPQGYIRELINKYNKTEGVVTDPTDSKFSFRIK